jgi:hypothetical protein
MSDSVHVTGAADRALMEMIVFPIIKALYLADGTEEHKLVGTAFFLDGNRRFLTAKHVIDGRGGALDPEGAERLAVYCVHSVHLSRKMVARFIDVDSIVVRADTDIASGIVALQQFGRANPMIAENEMVGTAYFNGVTVDPVPVLEHPASRRVLRELSDSVSQGGLTSACSRRRLVPS